MAGLLTLSAPWRAGILILAVLVGLLGCSARSAAEDVDKEVKRLIDIVNDETNNTSIRNSAAKKLGEFGEKKGQPAIRALCLMVTSGGSMQKNALDALGKIAPTLFPDVQTLAIDSDPLSHLKVINKFAQQGTSVKATTPLIAAHTRSMQRVAGKLPDYNNFLLKHREAETLAIELVVEASKLDKAFAFDSFVQRNRNISGKASKETLLKEQSGMVALAGLIALVRISGDDPDILEVIAASSLGLPNNNITRYTAIVAIKLAEPKAALAVLKQVKRAKTDQVIAIRDLAVELDKTLTELAKKKGKEE